MVLEKHAVLAAILARLRADLAALAAAARASHDDATNPENKAENKYDTRGLEASYLAQGQSKAAEETAQSLAQFQALELRHFAPNEPIAIGALVAVETGGKRSLYFMGPRAGGTEVEVAGREILVITPQSPLGRLLLSKHAGDSLTGLPGQRAGTASSIVSVA